MIKSVLVHGYLFRAQELSNIGMQRTPPPGRQIGREAAVGAPDQRQVCLRQAGPV